MGVIKRGVILKFNIPVRKNPNLKKYKEEDIKIARDFGKKLYGELGNFLKGLVIFGSAVKEKRGDKGVLWGAHRVGIEHEYCHIEKLSNLDKLPTPFGFKVAVFPIKIEKASAGWVRAVAILEGENKESSG